LFFAYIPQWAIYRAVSFVPAAYVLAIQLPAAYVLAIQLPAAYVLAIQLPAAYVLAIQLPAAYVLAIQLPYTVSYLAARAAASVLFISVLSESQLQPEQLLQSVSILW
jgi:hypothetical protein